MLVILGLLGYMLVPRVVDVRASAYHALLEGTAGAFDAAVQFAHVACVVHAWADRDDLPGFGEGDVDFNDACFPTDTSGANDIGNNRNRCVRVWRGILIAAPSIAGNPNSDYRAEARDGVCTYALAVDRDAVREFTYDSLTGRVAVTSNP